MTTRHDTSVASATPWSEGTAGSRIEIQPQPWTVDALCTQVDTDLFFPDKGGSTREAKKVCSNCIVSAECLVYAIDNDERFGIWGGLSERERRAIAKKTKSVQPSTQGLAS